MLLWPLVIVLICLNTESNSIRAQATYPAGSIRDNEAAVYTLYSKARVHQAGKKAAKQDILVYEDKIASIGASGSLSIPDNTRVIDLDGLEIYPSFLDLHQSYGMPKAERSERGAKPQYERSTNRPGYWNEAVHPDYSAASFFAPDVEAAKNLRAMGIGLSLSIPHDGVARGRSALVLTGDGKAEELLVKNDPCAHFSFEKGNSSQEYPRSLMGGIALLRQAILDARWYKSSEQHKRNASLEALSEQLGESLHFAGKDALDLARIGALGEELDLDFIVFDPGFAYLHIGHLSPRISALILPLALPKPYDTNDPDLIRFIDQQDMIHWEWAPFGARKLHEAGMPFALSSHGIDDPKQFFISLRKLSSTGIPEDALLKALTTSPASLAGATDRAGKLEEGYPAHFFASRGSIFSDKDAELLFHIIGGERYEVNPEPDATLAGEYDLNIDNAYMKLKVKGEHPKYSAQVFFDGSQGPDSVKAHISLIGRELTLSFADTSSSAHYRLSASARSQNRIWDGTGILPDGRLSAWSAIKNKDKNENSSAPKNGENGDRNSSNPPYPPLPLPASAYGFDSLPQQETLLISGATIWTNSEPPKIHNGEVLIHKGKILAVGKNLLVAELLPKGAINKLNTLDAQGMHLTPGLVDEHSHIAISRGVNEGTHASTAEVRIGDAINPHDINIFRMLSGGVTSAQLLHGSANPIGGQSAIIKMRWGQPSRKLLFAEAPPFIKFALGENVKQSNWGDRYTSRYPQTRMGVEQFIYDRFHAASEYKQKKKLHEASLAQSGKWWQRGKKLDPNAFRYDRELDALTEILEGKRFISCHSYVQSEINMLMHLADSMGFTVNTFTHVLEGYKIADKMLAHGAAGSTFSDWWAYKYEVRDAIPYNAAMMHQAGVLTAINSDDAEMARRLNQEAAKAMKYGKTDEVEALKMVSLYPAIMLHLDEYVGKIEAGMHADLVLWNDHPLSVYARAEYTFVDGIRYFDRSKLESMMERDRKERNRIADAMKKAKDQGAETLKPARKMERYYHCDDIEEEQ